MLDDEKFSSLKELLNSAVEALNHSEEQAFILLSDAFRAFVHVRRKRDHIFPEGYFADTAWDILIQLYAARLDNRSMTATALCANSTFPLTTGLRYLNMLEKDGYIVKRSDENDRRRTLIDLSDAGLEAMHAVFKGSFLSQGRSVPDDDGYHQANVIGPYSSS